MNERSKIVVIGDKTYTINKFKATEGRRIIAGYPVTAIPKFGDYERNEEIMLRLMMHIEVHLQGGNKVVLQTKELIDNHVPSWEQLVELEYEALKFNCPFMQGDGLKPFIESLKESAASYVAEIMEKALLSRVLTNSSDSSAQ